jgi:hypothetical protein
MVDLPKLLDEKAKEKNEKLLEQILIHLATNQRSLEEGEFKKFMTKLSKQVNPNQDNAFDRDKMEELRMLTEMGANRAR